MRKLKERYGLTDVRKAANRVSAGLGVQGACWGKLPCCLTWTHPARAALGAKCALHHMPPHLQMNFNQPEEEYIDGDEVGGPSRSDRACALQ